MEFSTEISSLMSDSRSQTILWL